MNNFLVRSLYALILMLVVMPALAIEDPVALVKQTSERVLHEVSSRKQELTASPGKIYGLVDNIVLPRFDFARMSRLVLGKHWRQASGQEQHEFVEEFRELLVRTYASALLNYSGQEIKYLPARLVEGATEVTVNTEVSEKGAPAVPINYNLYLDGNSWKVFDVVIDGVSLVSNYRSSFNTQIRRYKIEGLIASLKERNQQGK
ncbi:MAG: toluene tolerance protein [Sedimenticola sp.]|nr:MAG: toluene tolerance protein [Sedimenticola sp.]